MNLNRTKWKGKILRVERAKPKFQFKLRTEIIKEDKQEKEKKEDKAAKEDDSKSGSDSESTSDSEESSSEENPENKMKVKVILNPGEGSAVTMQQYVWENAYFVNLHTKASKAAGVNGLKIATKPATGKRRKVFKEEDWELKPTIKKLEDFWGSSEDEDESFFKKDTRDKENFSVDSRFVLDSRFSEEFKELEGFNKSAADQLKRRKEREENRQNRLEEGDTEMEENEEDGEIMGEEELAEQIRREREKSLNILTLLNLNDESLTARPVKKITTEETNKASTNEVLWGSALPRYDPKKAEATTNDPSTSHPESGQSDDSEGENESEDKKPEKKVVVNTSWARATLTESTTWSLFSGAGDDDNQTSAPQPEATQDPAPSFSTFQDTELPAVVSFTRENQPRAFARERENQSRPFANPRESSQRKTERITSSSILSDAPIKKGNNFSLPFFGSTKLPEVTASASSFMRQKPMFVFLFRLLKISVLTSTSEEIENNWLQNRKNVITDYKRKSKQAVKRNQRIK